MMLVTLRVSRPSVVVVVERAGACLSFLCTVGLVMVLFVLLPLAHASPTDPLWVAGIYDGADLDESIEAVNSIVGIVEGLPPGLRNPLVFIVRVIPPENAALPQAAAPSTSSVRAPPGV